MEPGNADLLEQPAQELLQQVQDQPHYAWLAEPVARLVQDLGNYLGQGGLPQGVAREQLLTALADLSPVLRRPTARRRSIIPRRARTRRCHPVN